MIPAIVPSAPSQKATTFSACSKARLHSKTTKSTATIFRSVTKSTASVAIEQNTAASTTINAQRTNLPSPSPTLIGAKGRSAAHVAANATRTRDNATTVKSRQCRGGEQAEVQRLMIGAHHQFRIDRNLPITKRWQEGHPGNLRPHQCVFGYRTANYIDNERSQAEESPECHAAHKPIQLGTQNVKHGDHLLPQRPTSPKDHPHSASE